MRQPIRLVGTFERRSHVGEMLREPGDVALVLRGRPRLLVVKCPCGCGEEYSVNLDPEAGKAWRLYLREGKLTLFPSVWRDSACEAHYVVWNNNAYVIRGDDEQPEHRPALAVDPATVLAAVSTDWVFFVDLADQLDQIPWDTLDACRALVRQGKLEEGRREHHAHFRRRENPKSPPKPLRIWPWGS